MHRFSTMPTGQIRLSVTVSERLKTVAVAFYLFVCTVLRAQMYRVKLFRAEHWHFADHRRWAWALTHRFLPYWSLTGVLCRLRGRCRPKSEQVFVFKTLSARHIFEPGRPWAISLLGQHIAVVCIFCTACQSRWLSDTRKFIASLHQLILSLTNMTEAKSAFKGRDYLISSNKSLCGLIWSTWGQLNHFIGCYIITILSSDVNLSDNRILFKSSPSFVRAASFILLPMNDLLK